MKSVTVLLSTYNGEKYLNEQIDSLVSQINVNLSIVIRDDGSTDQTINILKRREELGEITWYSGRNLKPARSFMELVYQAPKSDYYAFCDQDDVWDIDKLDCAINKLDKFDKNVPSLYFSNTRLVDSNLKIISKNNKTPKISLGSALLVNPAIGCTIVFNYSLLQYLKQYLNNNIHMHDAWVYRVCSALKGNIVFDEMPHISYRQHEENVVGGNASKYNKYKRRISDAVINKKRIREKDARSLLLGYSHMMDEYTISKVEKVAYYRKNVMNKSKLIFDKKIRTNSLEHNISFFISVLLNSL